MDRSRAGGSTGVPDVRGAIGFVSGFQLQFVFEQVVKRAGSEQKDIWLEKRKLGV
jgi:hypothetical protein